jgi:hypothetical protein
MYFTRLEKMESRLQRDAAVELIFIAARHAALRQKVKETRQQTKRRIADKGDTCRRLTAYGEENARKSKKRKK